MFGGSFNPVHNGHIELAKAVHEQAGYDKVLFVPAYHSPFKDMPSGASDDDRLCMLRLALNGFDWACIEDCELKRGGVSYTYDTVEFLTRKYAASGEFDEKRDGKLGLVIGADLVEGFARWYRAEELAAKVDIILARRKLNAPYDKPHIPAPAHDASQNSLEKAGSVSQMPHETAPQTQAGLPFVHYELQNPYVDVSSSEIRDAVRCATRNATNSRNTKAVQSGASGGSQVSVVQSAKNAQSSKIAQSANFGPSAKIAQSSNFELKALVPESVCDYILDRGLYD